jgi:hypothetical protein
MEYPYNAIIGRGTLNTFEAILHPAYLCIKIPSDQGPIYVHGSQEVARRAEGNWTNSRTIHNIDEAETIISTNTKEIRLLQKTSEAYAFMRGHSRAEGVVGSQLSDEQEKTPLKFLFNNKDVFAWLANDLCGVNRDVIEHSLTPCLDHWN